MDNIHVLKFFGDTLYVGSEGGIAWANVTLAPPATDPNDPGNPTHIGSGTPGNALLSVTGEGVVLPGYFTISDLKTTSGLPQRTRTYPWLNNYGTRGESEVTGFYIEDLLRNVMTLAPGAQSIAVVAGDGYKRNFDLISSGLGVYWTDANGNKLMLAWASDGSISASDTELRLIVGQTAPNNVNRDGWVRDVVSIVVSVSPAVSGEDSQGRYNPNATIRDGDVPLAERGEEVYVKIDADITVKDGVVSATVTDEAISGAIEELNEKASNDNAVKTIVISATTGENTAKTEFTLPKAELESMLGNGHTGFELLTDQGDFVISAELLGAIDEQGDGALKIAIETVDAADVGSGIHKAVDISITIGSTTVKEFDGLLMKVTIPFLPVGNLLPEGLVVYHISASGDRTLIKLAVYDPETQRMVIALRHLSTYAIGSNNITFADIQGHWGQRHIEFLASRGIVNGRAQDAFEPQGTVTRAEFVKMLAESVDGIAIADGGGSGFSDVPGDAWYSGYVRWAAGLGIVQGYEDGTFRPNGFITRQEMAVMLDRYIRSMGFGLSVVRDVAEYPDAEKIASFATGAINTVQRYGIMTGNADGTFNPTGTATRAEAARVMRAYIDAVLK